VPTTDTLRRLRRIEITTRRVVRDTLAGQYHSVFKGRGMAFSEVRPYQPGDEVRTIDWNVTARLGEPYVKVFTEERELTVMLLVDRSASGDAGTGRRARSVLAAELAALLAFSATSNNDRVGLALFAEGIERFVPARKGRGHVMRVVSEVLNYQPRTRGTDLAGALTFLHQHSRRSCVAFVVSDFLAAGWERPLAVAAGRHDIIPIVLTEPSQGQLPDVGLMQARDAETGAQVLVDTSSRAVREALAQSHQEACARRDREFRRLRMQSITLGADDDYVAPLVRFFEQRAQRGRA